MAARSSFPPRKICLPSVSALASVPVSPITICSPSVAGSATGILNLGDKEKRWVVVGICLNHVVVPVLRETVKKEITKHYNNLKATHNIDTQVYGTHLKQDTTFKFNYKSINNNINKRKEHLYDYTVKSPEELGKLYLQPHMAQFTAFDTTCDASALLGILCNASVFSAVIQKNAVDVRTSVRNEWGHCNFDNWDGTKFTRSFQFMKTLVQSVGLTAGEEKQVIDELRDWQNKGLLLCLGCPVDEELVKFVSDEVTELNRELEQMKISNKEEAQRVSESLKTVSDAVVEFHAQLEKLRLSQDALESRVFHIQDKQNITDARVTTAEEEQKKSKGEQEKLKARVETLELKGGRPSKKAVIFNAPDRNLYFCGRDEQLKSLEENMTTVEKGGCKISAVCGLGGTGKTSLVVEHIWLQKEVYKGGVFWLSGDSNRAFQLSLCDMARQLGLDEGQEKFSETLSRTLDWLQRTEQKFCLVVNNLDEMELSGDMIRIFRGQWRRGSRAHIVITSRREPRELSEEVGVDEQQCIELKNLTEEEGLRFFKMRTGSTSDKEDSIIRELVCELGGLPLALDQAAAYIRCVRSDFSSYLAKFKEEKLSLLKKRKAPALVENTAPERLAVHTTWTVNFEYVARMSQDFGLGQAAAIVMEMSAYLAPDDIPFSIINQGLPLVENEDLRKCASSSTGGAEILSILTKFSLFQRDSANSYSVHRLVQEVIRDRITDQRVVDVLHSAVRMLHFSFCHTTSPMEVCTQSQKTAPLTRETLPSLRPWEKLALHACVLQEHLQSYVSHNHTGYATLLYTEEMARLLSEASVYLNVSREIARALELQRKMLELLVRIEKSPRNENSRVLNSLHIPLEKRNFRLIAQCLKQEEPSEGTSSVEAHLGNSQQLPPQQPPEKIEELRLRGNQLVQKKNYKEALGLYTQGIELCANDYRLFSNRALCYLKLGSPEEGLEDCDRCLHLKPFFTKALMRKVWALHELVMGGATHLKNCAQATADLTVHIDPTLSGELTMFPKFSPWLVSGPLHLIEVLSISKPGITLLLEEGEYDLSSLYMCQDLQVIGLGAGVTLRCARECRVVDCTSYFENITFPKGSPSILCTDATVSFHNCVISGGLTSCEDFPDCNGGPGCVSVSKGKVPCKRGTKYGSREQQSGIEGYPGVMISNCTAYIDRCSLSHCGRAGMECVGDAVVYVNNCEVFHNHKGGIEVSSGVKLIATGNRVYGNRFFGILVGPNAGSCELTRNKIFENSYEGLVVRQTAEEVKVEDNDVYHNASFGLSLEKSSLIVSKNRIFENGFWGILAVTGTTAHIIENTLFCNKCGGIYIGLKFSGRIVLDSNVVRDHTGPWLDLTDHVFKTAGQSPPPEETACSSHPPILRDNKEFDNEEIMQHPRERIQKTERQCGFCHRLAGNGKLSHCSKCYIAVYCSKECQLMHWSRHKEQCAVIASRYSVTVGITPICGIGKSKRLKGPRPNPKSHKRFVVRIRTQNLNSHPFQLLFLRDRSHYIDCKIQSTAVFHFVMECGVLHAHDRFCKEAYFWATFAERGKKITIFLDDLAPLQHW